MIWFIIVPLMLLFMGCMNTCDSGWEFLAGIFFLALPALFLACVCL